MEYSLDTWTSIFLVAAAQGLFLAILLFNKKNRSKTLLGILVFLFSLTLIEYVFFWTGYRFVFPHLNRISEPFFFLYGPLIYFYSRSLSRDETLNATIVLLHSIPFIVSFLMMLPYFFLSGEIKIQYMTQQFLVSNAERFFIIMKPWIQVLSMGVYTIFAYSKIKAQNNKGNTPLKIIVLFLGFIISFSSYYLMILIAGYFKNYDYAISISMSVFIYCIGFLGYRNSLEIETEVEKYQSSNLKKEEVEHVLANLKEVMTKEKLYLQRNLNLEKLANAVDTSRHTLSQILNEKMGVKFSDFINEHRINEAKELIVKKNQELSINGIALESGFNNKTSFNTAFKKFEGCTPSQFLQKNSVKAVNSD